MAVACTVQGEPRPIPLSRGKGHTGFVAPCGLTHSFGVNFFGGNFFFISFFPKIAVDRLASTRVAPSTQELRRSVGSFEEFAAVQVQQQEQHDSRKRVGLRRPRAAVLPDTEPCRQACRLGDGRVGSGWAPCCCSRLTVCAPPMQNLHSSQFAVPPKQVHELWGAHLPVLRRRGWIASSSCCRRIRSTDARPHG